MLTSQEEYIKRVFKNESIDFKNPLCNNCNECCTITAMITPDEYKKLNKFLKTKGKSIYKDAVSRHIKLAKKYNCSSTTIGNICRGQSYKKEELKYPLRKRNAVLNNKLKESK